MEPQCQEITNNHIETDYIRQIMRDIKNGVMAVDKTGKILYVNPEMAMLLERSDLIGASLHTLITENENAVNDTFWDAVLEATYHHKLHHQKEAPFVSPSGKRRSFHITTSYLGGETGSDAKGVVITVSDETERDNAIIKRKDTTVFLIGLLLLVCLTVLVSEIHTFLNGAFPHEYIARATEILGCIVVLCFLKFTSITVKDFGIFPTNIKKELLESGLVIFVMIAAMSIGKWVMIATGSTFFPSGKPFFDFSAPTISFYIGYIFIAFFQEVLTKCGLQKGLLSVFDGKHGNWIAIFITSVMFMALHLQHGLIYMLGAGLLSAILAILYNRHDSLLGVFLVHYSFGIMGEVIGWVT